MQWLQKLRSSQPQDPALDACVSATCAAVMQAVTCHGPRAVRAAKVAIAIACVAQRSNAALVMRSLLASQHCKDAPGEQSMALLDLLGLGIEVPAVEMHLRWMTLLVSCTAHSHCKGSIIARPGIWLLPNIRII